jgi:hypothetical protein
MTAMPRLRIILAVLVAGCLSLVVAIAGAAAHEPSAQGYTGCSWVDTQGMP